MVISFFVFNLPESDLNIPAIMKTFPSIKDCDYDMNNPGWLFVEFHDGVKPTFFPNAREIMFYPESEEDTVVVVTVTCDDLKIVERLERLLPDFYVGFKSGRISVLSCRGITENLRFAIEQLVLSVVACHSAGYTVMLEVIE